MMTLVPPSGAIVGSNFLLSNEGWTIVGNKALTMPAKHEPYSRGLAINQYVLGSEDKINVGAQGAEDNSLWYFRAPSSFLGNQGIAYGGQLKFTLASFSGDFNALNSHVCLRNCSIDRSDRLHWFGLTAPHAKAQWARELLLSILSLPRHKPLPSPAMVPPSLSH